MMFECESLGARESFGKVSVLYAGGESKLGLCGDLEGQNTACARPDVGTVRVRCIMVVCTSPR